MASSVPMQKHVQVPSIPTHVVAVGLDCVSDLDGSYKGLSDEVGTKNLQMGASELDRKLARARQRAEGLAQAPVLGCSSRSLVEDSFFIGGYDDLVAVVECSHLPEPPIAPSEEPFEATLLALDDEAAVGARSPGGCSCEDVLSGSSSLEGTGNICPVGPEVLVALPGLSSESTEVLAACGYPSDRLSAESQVACGTKYEDDFRAKLASLEVKLDTALLQLTAETCRINRSLIELKCAA